MKITFFKPLTKALIIGMWMLLMITPALFAAQQWVVAEVFTATTCGFCPSARSALRQMNDNQEQFPYLIPIIWQGNAAHASPNYGTRRTLYGFTGIPHARFCGNVEVRGGGANVLNAYTNAYNNTVTRNSPMEIDVAVSVNAQNQLVVSADFELTANVTTQNNHAIFVLTYDLTGIMDPDYFASAKTYHAQEFNLTQQGQETNITRNIPIEADWELERIRAVVFVQSLNQGNPVILQGGFGYPGQFEPVDVFGRVLGSDAPEGLVGASVRMSGAGGNFQTDTGDNGNFTLEDVMGNEQGAEYVLTISHEGYEPHVSGREVGTQNLNLGNIELQESEFVNVRGRVIGNDRPDGVPGATVQLTRAAANYEVESGADGSFLFENVMTTEQGVLYELFISLEGYSEHSSEREVGAEGENFGNIQINEEPYPVHDVWASQSDEPDELDLIWTTPGPVTGTEQWLHWDSGENANGIGTGGAVQFIVAQRFDAEQLEENDAVGLHLTTVRFFPREAGHTYTIKVFRGGSGNPLNPGQEVASQRVTNVQAMRWNEVDLENPVEILADQEIWFGYHLNATGGHPAGVDAGPHVNNYGNLMFFDNSWTTLVSLNPQLAQNWNVQAYAGFTRGHRSLAFKPGGIETIPDANKSLDSDFQSFSYVTENPGFFTADPHNRISEFGKVTDNSRVRRSSGRTDASFDYRLLEGYDIYRFKVEDQDDPDEWTFVDTAEDTIYTDTGWGSHLAPGEYRYAVVAVYTNEVYSVPAFSNSVMNRMHSSVQLQLSSNSGDSVAGASVMLTNADGNPDHVYEGDANAEGLAVIGNVWKGTYHIRIRLPGFERYDEANVLIQDDVHSDNIELTEALNEVVQLSHELYNNNNVRLSWLEPGTLLGDPQWIHWDNGEFAAGIGTGAAVQFTAASRFTPANMEELNIGELHLTSIKFYPFAEGATFTLKVWRGGSATPLNPGNEVHSQPVTSFVNNQWNTIPLTEAIYIDPSQELWFGYTVDTPSGHPAGADAGPAVNNYGNLFFIGNQWTTLQAQAINANWSLQAYAGTEDDLRAVNVSRERLRQNDAGRSSVEENSRALIGYKIMRNNEVLEDGFQGLTYQDTDLPIGEYVYHLIAQYTTGESEPTSTEPINVLNIEDDTQIMPLVTELQGNYPNPFNPNTNINFSIANDANVRIDVFNLKGQKVRTLVNELMEAGNHKVIWDGTNDRGNEVGSGIYLYRMESLDYTTTKKMILMK